MENKKSNNILLTIIGVATLLIALVGATFAYFTASSTSGNHNVDTGKLNISTALVDSTNDNIIPTEFTDGTAPKVDDVVDVATVNANINDGDYRSRAAGKRSCIARRNRSSGKKGHSYNGGF